MVFNVYHNNARVILSVKWKGKLEKLRDKLWMDLLSENNIKNIIKLCLYQLILNDPPEIQKIINELAEKFKVTLFENLT